MNRQARPSVVFWMYGVLASAIALFSLSCGNDQQEPEAPIIIVEDEDTGPDSDLDTGQPDVDDSGPDVVEVDCDDPANLMHEDCVPEFCDMIADAPDEEGPCTVNEDCALGQICSAGVEYPHERRCRRICLKDTCESSCGEDMFCNVAHWRGESDVLPNGEELGICASVPPQRDFGTCRAENNCTIGSMCMLYTHPNIGQCQPLCNPARPTCSVASQQGICVEFSSGESAGTCLLPCDDTSDCPSPTICKDGVLNNTGVCIAPEAANEPCQPTTCAAEGAECGTIETCGETLSCGECSEGESCNAENRCECAPTTCEELGAECGTIDDGCGGALDCGGCDGFESCGEEGTPEANLCQACVALTCEDAGAQCGAVDDGCGGELDCGGCEAGEACGEAGSADANQCVCAPTVTCESAGVVCGSIDDGCGNTLECEECPAFETCGGGGEPEVCGCTPTTCEDEGRSCGSIADGCGNTLNCGDCPNGYCDAGQCEFGCDPVRQLGCPASDERCIYMGNLMGNRCEPLAASPKEDGRRCEAGECSAGSLCTAARSESICRSYCYNDSDCPDVLEYCVYSANSSNGLGYCNNSCDPVFQIGCRDGLACRVLNIEDRSEVTECEQPGTAEEGDSCFNPHACEAGLACVGGSCRSICSTNFHCSPGETCQQVQDWSTYGVCV